MRDTFDVVIVGGGIAGLVAAYDLQRRGQSVTVLEAGARAGGVIVTERFDGWVVDGGPDALLVQKPAAVDLCRELGLGERLTPTRQPRTAYVLRDGRLHALAEGSFLGFPLSFRSLARASLFSMRGRLRMACEPLVPKQNDSGDESIAAFVRRRFGQEAVDYLAEPLLAGIHAGDVERLSMRALFPRLLEAEQRAGSVLRSFRAMRITPSPQGAFLSLPGGVGELVDTLTAALAPGTVRLAARVTELRRGAGYTVDSSAGSVHARAVVLAAPAYVTAELVRGLDTALAAACESVAYASTATVALGYKATQVSHPMRGSGFVVPKAERRALLAGTWVTSKWPGRAPEGHVLLRGFLGGGRDPHRLDETDDRLVALARAELTGLLGISGEPLFTRLFRWSRQSPQYEVGHLDRLAGIQARLPAIPGLFVTGSGFRGIGIPDGVADARATAAQVEAFLHPARG